MTWGLSFILSLTALLMQPPILEGVCTWYPPTGDLMRNGQPYDPTAATCAVSGLVYDEHVGKTFLFCTTWRCGFCAVTDSGDPEEFAKHGVVLDATPAVFGALRGRGENDGRLEIKVWEVRR